MDTGAESNSDPETSGSEEEEDEGTTLKIADIIISDSDDEEDDDEVDYEDCDELPPILEPPSTGYLHTVDENQPPPTLLTVNELGIMRRAPTAVAMEKKKKEDNNPEVATEEVVDIRDSDDEGSTTTDSDDDRVDVDYHRNPPVGFKNLLRKYEFLNQRETWVYNVRNLYKKQPSRIRRLLKIHKDAAGNPVEEPVEMLFEKIHAERERMRKAQNIKIEKKDDTAPVPSSVKLNISNSHPLLIHVAYPGNVVNNDKAVETLGGIGNLSKTFEQSNKKLLLKFRPNDPFANGVTGQPRTSCGLLLSVKRRKNSRRNLNASSSNTLPEMGAAGLSGNVSAGSCDQKINLDELGSEPSSTDVILDMLFDPQLLVQYPEKKGATQVALDGKDYLEHNLLDEDKMIMEERARKNRTKKAWGHGHGRTKDFNLKLPKILEAVPEDNIQVKTLGVVHRSYDFNGICDFQYLPITKKSDGNMISIKDKIFPVFGTADNPEKLVTTELMSETARCQMFSLPPAMSRIDNPPRGLIDELVTSEKSDSSTRKLPPDDSIFSNRMKRIIYTISYNFQADGNGPEDEIEVPSQPLSLALIDIERRQIKKDLIENVRLKFEERPVWSKAALEFATKIPNQTLKFIIPNFAYFAANGPWRNTWIKFGVDPRKNSVNVLYQSVDFRIPFVYRRFMNVSAPHPEANHKFMPDQIPPKTQMFYQLCDIKIDEIKDLVNTLLRKSEANELVYEERYGFLKEGSYEYFRYILNYYLENLLQENGKIPSSTKTDVAITINKGDIEPKDKLKAAPLRRMKFKRIRRSTKKISDPNFASVSVKEKIKSKSKSTNKIQDTESSGESNDDNRESSATNEQPSQSGSDEFYDEDGDFE